MKTKKCGSCNEVKDLEKDFSPDKRNTTDGRTTFCKKCKNAYAQIKRDELRTQISNSHLI